MFGRRRRRRGEGGFSRVGAGAAVSLVIIGGIVAGNNFRNDGDESGVAPTGPPAGTELCNDGADADAAFESPYPTLPSLSTVNADSQFADYDFTSVVNVPVGDNQLDQFVLESNTFYWLAPGVHTVGDTEFDGIGTFSESHMAFVGGGTADAMAVIDGQGINRYAFAGEMSFVTIQYVQVRDFVAPIHELIVNHDMGDDWVVSHNIIGPNEDGGAGLGLGQNQVVTNNCLFQNGQYGINGVSVNCEPGAFPDIAPGGTCAVSGVLIDTNEFMENNWHTFDSGPSTNVTVNGWDTGVDGAGCPNCGYDNYPTPGTLDAFVGNCGCSGAMKLWVEYDTDVSNNWIHDNHAPGIWADTINTDVRMTGNYIEGNWGVGIVYEVSYNAQIKFNRLENNAWVGGSYNQSFPVPAIYMSEAGYNELVEPNDGSGFTAISGNVLVNNWGGVTLWENVNRFCTQGLPTDQCTSPQFDDPANTGATLDTCDAIAAGDEIATNDPLPDQGLLWTCRWNTANVRVTDNVFEFDPDAIDPDEMTPYNAGNSCADSYCGSMSIISIASSSPAYPGDVLAHSIVWDQGNVFDDNEYIGPWTFDTNEPNQTFPHAPLSFTQWQTAQGSRGGSGVNTEDRPGFDENSTCTGC